ncbi:hypothetical protein [Nocardia sp. NBC_00403]|uniref:hypothetical protein n=1 Tax=Nocardia sp. NBC_00403 TaxID=2975990 RepID=UPI003FA60871
MAASVRIATADRRGSNPSWNPTSGAGQPDSYTADTPLICFERADAAYQHPDSVAVASSGDVLVTDPSNSTVWRLPPP